MKTDKYLCPICNKKDAKISQGLHNVVVCYCRGKCQEVGIVQNGRYIPSRSSIVEEKKEIKFDYKVVEVTDDTILMRIGLGMAHACARNPWDYLKDSDVYLFIPKFLGIETEKELINFIQDASSRRWKNVALLVVDKNKEIVELIGYRNFSISREEEQKIRAYLKFKNIIN